MKCAAMMLLCLLPAVAQETRAGFDLKPRSPRQSLGLALRQIVAGDAEGGVELASASGADADELASLKAIAALSDAVLSAYRDAKRNLTLSGEKTLTAQVKSFDAKEIVLVDLKGRETTLPRSCFGLNEMLAARQKLRSSLGDPLTVGSALVLAGKSADEAIRAAQARDSLADRIRARGEKWPALLRQGEARALLEALESISRNLPEDPAAALADLELFFERFAETEAKAQHEEALWRLAETLLALEFDRRPFPQRCFRVAVEALEGGIVLLRTPFEARGDVKRLEGSPPPLTKTAGDAAGETSLLDAVPWRHDPGGLLFEDANWEFGHQARFEGAISVACTVLVEGTRRGSAPPPGIAFTIDDTQGSRCRGGVESGRLFLEIEKPGTAQKHRAEGKPAGVQRGDAYSLWLDLKLEHQGREFVLSADEQEIARVPDHGLRGGRVLFSLLGEARFLLDDVQIRGAVDPRSAGDVRRVRVGESLAAWRAGRKPSDPEPVLAEKGAIADGVVTGPFAGRRATRSGGRDRKSAVQAVDLGLQWLANHQSSDGSWDCDDFIANCKTNRCTGRGHPLYDAGVSGLALLAFLGWGHTHDFGPYKETVRRGLRHLKNIQDAEGCFGERTSANFTYGHAICALAMAEAYGLTSSPLFKASAQKGIDFIHECKNPFKAWRYGVRSGENDSSVTGWMVMALRSAMAAKLEVNAAELEDARNFLDEVTDEYGKVGYTQRGTGPIRNQGKELEFPADYSESLTAIGVLARMLMGEDPATSDKIKKGAALMAKKLPVWDKPKLDFYYWHFGTLALYGVGGNEWDEWSKAMLAAIIDRQRKDGDEKGSWEPEDAWGEEGGRVYSTALITRCLQVYSSGTRKFTR